MRYPTTPEQKIAANISTALHLVNELADSTMKEALFAAFGEMQIEVFRRSPHLLH